MSELISVIIRTYNEEEYLAELLQAIHDQDLGDKKLEVVIVDSGSTDRTLPVAESFKCHITHISKKDFTFGRSLNRGCEHAWGSILVLVSGHCVPVDSSWLLKLIKPLLDGDAAYTYGRQLGRDTTKFSEYQVFEKYYPSDSKIPQKGFFCNNANAALMKTTWERQRFDEGLTGLEDMHFAKRLVEQGYAVAYVAEAGVYHIHHEDWRSIRIRYERESLALRKIMPELHLGIVDVIRYFGAAIVHDSRLALKNKQFVNSVAGIFAFRFAQYWGTYKGNHRHRKLSSRRKEAYFYPKNK